MKNTLCDQLAMEEIKGEIRKLLKSNENENKIPEPLEPKKCSSKRRIYSHESLH
jgi:hypothetical protein